MSGAVAGLVLCAVSAWLALATYRLLADRAMRAHYMMTVRAIRWWTAPAAIGHVAGVVVVMVLLRHLVPMLGLGWWMLLGGMGNVLLGQTGNAGLMWRVVAVAIPLLLIVLIPHFAYQEEMVFRYGCEKVSRHRQFRRQVVFGLSHSAWAGVPIAAGIALIASGTLFQCVYLASLRRTLDQTELVEEAQSPPRLDYPPTPERPYDAGVWHAHRREFDRVAEENRVLREQWLMVRTEQRQRRRFQVDDLRKRAAAHAAALHAVSNWLIVGLLVVWLVVKSA